MSTKIATEKEAKKGGTVVPPSDFQSVTTKCSNTQQVSEKSSRPHERAQARAHDETPKAQPSKSRKNRKKLNVLIACEESQAECIAFRELGHNAYSCDIQKCKPSGQPDWHIVGDVTPYLEGRTTFKTQSGKKGKVSHWDLIIAHPPCTFLCRLSSCQLYKEPTTECIVNGQEIIANEDRIDGMRKGRAFFMKCLNAKANYVAVENPIPMRLANLPRPSCYADPSWFGVKYTKKTCYWLKNLPPIMAGVQFPQPKSYVNASRGKYRSRTFPQLAKAIASQWSQYILDEINH